MNELYLTTSLLSIKHIKSIKTKSLLHSNDLIQELFVGNTKGSGGNTGACGSHGIKKGVYNFSACI